MAPASGRAAVALAPVLAAALALLPGCGATLEQRVTGAQRAFYGGDVDRAAELLQKRLARDSHSPDAGLLRLELASALQAAGRYAEAAAQLVAADDALEILDYDSAPLRELAWALFAVPRSEYRASRPEKLLVNVENILNFLGLGDWEGAAVEARRARILMLQSDLRASRRYESAFAWSLAGLALQLAGRDGEAAGCFREAAGARDAAGARGPAGGRDAVGGVAADIAHMEAAPGPGQGSVLVVVQNGKAPVRAQAEYHLFLHGGLHRLQIPALAARGGAFSRALVGVDGTPAGEAPVLLDLAAQAGRRWDDEFPRLLAAAALQMLPRAALGAAVKRKLETRHDSNPLQDALAEVAGLWAEETLAEALPSDTRCWSLLPRDVRALRLSVPAGRHTVTLDLVDAPDRPPRRMEWEVTVEDGGFALVNAVTGPLEGWSPTPEPHGDDVSDAPAGQQALELLEAALAWREAVRH